MFIDQPESLFNFHHGEHARNKDWYSDLSITPVKEGFDCCSKNSVAFHYIDPDLMRRMHAILYGYCDDVFKEERMLTIE